jgi:glycosyltransferase involved in cell wall biosynthesis
LSMERQLRICLVPRLVGIGGMVSFQEKFATGLNQRNIKVSYDLRDTPYDAVLVIGGTRQLPLLWQVKHRGIPIVQRLDGMNWIHRIMDTGRSHWLRSEYGNFILATIRSSLTTKIAYQSEFSRFWWEKARGKTPCQYRVIHNAVDLTKFTPGEGQNLPQDVIRILLVEGSLLGGYEFGLENAVKLSSGIAHSHKGIQSVELIVVGKVSTATINYWETWIGSNEMNQRMRINWMGAVPHHEIADIYRSAHLFYSADINAACPNSVIEAMACGTPVAAFDTGALIELLGEGGGISVPYGGDPWKLDSPDIYSLVKGVLVLLADIDHYRETARRRAESAFNLDRMVDGYLDLLIG